MAAKFFKVLQVFERLDLLLIHVLFDWMTTQSNPTDSQIQQNQLCFQMIKNFNIFLQKGMKFDIETDQKTDKLKNCTLIKNLKFFSYHHET